MFEMEEGVDNLGGTKKWGAEAEKDFMGRPKVVLYVGTFISQDEGASVLLIQPFSSRWEGGKFAELVAGADQQIVETQLALFACEEVQELLLVGAEFRQYLQLLIISHIQAQGGKDVLRGGDALGAVFDQVIRPLRVGVVDFAREGHQIAVLLDGMLGGDHGAAVQRAFHDEDIPRGLR